MISNENIFTGVDYSPTLTKGELKNLAGEIGCRTIGNYLWSADLAPADNATPDNSYPVFSPSECIMFHSWTPIDLPFTTEFSKNPTIEVTAIMVPTPAEFLGTVERKLQAVLLQMCRYEGRIYDEILHLLNAIHYIVGKKFEYHRAEVLSKIDASGKSES